jgi:hypothetical protein
LPKGTYKTKKRPNWIWRSIDLPSIGAKESIASGNSGSADTASITESGLSGPDRQYRNLLVPAAAMGLQDSVVSAMVSPPNTAANWKTLKRLGKDGAC